MLAKYIKKSLVAIQVISFLSQFWFLVGCGLMIRDDRFLDNPMNAEMDYYIKNVPFVLQQTDFCGPAALAMVLNYYGDDVTQEEIAVEIFLPELKGTLIWDLQNYARKRGFNAEVANLDLNSVKEGVRSGIPVILLLDEGFSIYTKPHYIVVIAMDDNHQILLAHSSTNPWKRMSYDYIQQKWAKMNYLAIKIWN